MEPQTLQRNSSISKITSGVGVYQAGNVYVVDTGNRRIRKIS
jgi:hypothetical protein